MRNVRQVLLEIYSTTLQQFK